MKADQEALLLRKAAANRWIIENAPKRDMQFLWEHGKNYVEWDVLLEFMALYSEHTFNIEEVIIKDFLQWFGRLRKLPEWLCEDEDIEIAIQDYLKWRKRYK